MRNHGVYRKIAAMRPGRRSKLIAVGIGGQAVFGANNVHCIG
jgi:hypothetical protein